MLLSYPHLLSFLSDTGSLSFWSYLIGIGFTIIFGMVVYFSIKKSSFPDTKAQALVDMVKWLCATVVLGTITLIIADQYKERDQDVSEMQYFNNYKTEVMNKDGVAERMRLVRYLATVAPKGEIKDAWEAYLKVVNEEYDAYVKADSISRRLLSLTNLTKAQQDSLQDANRTKQYVSQALSSETHPATIYIQYLPSLPKEEVEKLRSLINANGFDAPALDKEDGCDNTIRYYHDIDLVTATAINQLLGGRFKLQKLNLKANQGVIEVWIKTLD